MMEKRDTRVQIVIVENGRYILLEHLAIKENKTFWGLPGGGREPGETDEAAAKREAAEETGLSINLLPVKHEVMLSGKTFLYNRIVTFLAYPVSGEAKVGYEPEAEVYTAYNYRLTGLKWQDFFSDSGLEAFTLKSVQPVRGLLDAAPIRRKAGILIHRRTGSGVEFLLTASGENTGRMALPRVDVAMGNATNETIRKASAAQVGVSADGLENRGFYFSQNQGSFYRTDVFSLPADQEWPLEQQNGMYWIGRKEAAERGVERHELKLLEDFMEMPDSR